jgi:maltooligosyltrehalose trehalohydrolase
MQRRYPIGAEPAPEGGVHFRVWAPRRKTVEVVIESPLPGGPDSGPGSVTLSGMQPSGSGLLKPEPNGYFSGLVPNAAPGSLYRLRLDGQRAFPDPASRFQPQGPHGPSQVIDPSAFSWHDQTWPGISLKGQVIYELHIGTFTPEGTFESALRELPELARAGFTVIEIMPVADFPGRFGWSYDGVGLFAPAAIYGTPQDLCRFVDAAHRIGLGVMLDVVYNHVGPDGNYLKQFSEDYFTDRYDNEWGDAINYDGANSCPVREWVVTNARYWVEEFHLDGLRLDATQQIFDSSAENIMAALARGAREAAAPRKVVITAENEAQHAKLARPLECGGYGIDALWNDDFHHSARVAMTGLNEGYYGDYRGQPQEFISAIKHGFLYQGQIYKWQKKRRGAPAFDLDPAQFVIYLQNHDQIANSCRGRRIHQITTPGRYRAMSALLLLAPGTPLVFQGQEFAASNHFYFFADHKPELQRPTREGRIRFLSQFESLAQPEMCDFHIDPCNPATFVASKLDLSERQSHAEVYQLYKDLLRLRREDAVFSQQKAAGVDGAVLAAEAFVLRFFGGRGEDRLLLVNLGTHLHLDRVPDPLLAPPEDAVWHLLWSSENPHYGGCGTPPVEDENNWHLPAHAALVMRSTSKSTAYD